MAQFVKGIDISKHKPEIDWELVQSQDIHFVFIKATQASDIVDPKFLEHWANATQAGMLRGAYHFMDPRVDGKAQAELFLRTVKLESGDLPPVLDIEEPHPRIDQGERKKGSKGAKQGNQKKGRKEAEKINNQFISCANSWLEIVKAETGRTPIVYSSAKFLEDRLTLKGTPPAWALQYPIWIAQWLNPPIREESRPTPARGWQPFTFWQYSNVGEVNGVYDDKERTKLTPVDMNYFNGTLEELYRFAGAPLPEAGASVTG